MKIRIGIIGAGARGIVGFGQLFVRDHAQECELVAVADKNRERAQRGLNFLGVKGDVYEKAGELLDRRDIDAVVVTSPDFLHEEHGVAAFNAGKNVLMDKPLATTARACLRVLEAAERAGKLLYMGFNLRHVPQIRKLKEIVSAGALGRLFSIHSIEYYDGGRTYMARWNRLRKYSGGLFVHKGSHDFDGFNWLMGETRPARVSCFGNVFSLNEQGLPFPLRPGVKAGPYCSACAYLDICPDRYRFGDEWVPTLTPELRAKYAQMWEENASDADGYHKDLCIFLSDKDTHDQGIASVEYENGATASHAEYFATSVTGGIYLVEGTHGHAEVDLRRNFFEVAPRWSQERIRYDIPLGHGVHLGADEFMVADFIASLHGCAQTDGSPVGAHILGRRRPAAIGIDGVWSVAVGEAAEISRAEHRMVEISEVLDTRNELLKCPRG